MEIGEQDEEGRTEQPLGLRVPVVVSPDGPISRALQGADVKVGNTSERRLGRAHIDEGSGQNLEGLRVPDFHSSLAEGLVLSEGQEPVH